jgi:UrcA family protein
MKVSALALALIALAGMSATTVRAETRAASQQKVSLKGVDFDNATEVASLYRRLDRVSRTICTSELGYEDDARAQNRLATQDRACAREALDKAVKSVGDQRLTSFHASLNTDGAMATAYVSPAK